MDTKKEIFYPPVKSYFHTLPYTWYNEHVFLKSIFNKNTQEYFENFPQLKSLMVISPEGPLYISPRAHFVLSEYAERSMGKTEDAFIDSIEDKTNFLGNMFNQIARESSQNFSWMKSFIPFHIEEGITEPEKTNRKTTEDVIKNIVDNRKDFLNKNTLALGVFRLFELCELNHINVVALSLKFLNKTNSKSPKDVLFEELETFNHEFGHAIINEYPYNHFFALTESSADAFAALTHIKTFGKNTGFIQKKIYDRNLFVIFGKDINDTQYYTSGIYFSAEYLAKKIDIENLSLKDLTWYAKKVVDGFSVKKDVLDKINKAYEAPRKINVSKTIEESKRWRHCLRAVARVMLDNRNDQDIYRAGKLYLSHPYTKKRIITSIEEGSYFWKKTFETMEAHEKATGFILNPVEAVEHTVFKKTLVNKNLLNKDISEEERQRIKHESSFIYYLEKEKERECGSQKTSIAPPKP